MPRKRASQKSLRVTARRTARNRAVKASLQDSIRKVRTSVTKKDSAKAKEALAAAIKKLDKAAKAKVLPPGRVNRLKSRLTLLVAKAGK